MTTIDDPELAAAYRVCRKLNAEHGKTFYLATGLLPASMRPHVHALYGFARYADDLVDHPGVQPGEPADRLADLGAELTRGLAGGAVEHPVVLAVVATVREFDIDQQYLTYFLASMASDLTVTRYADFDALRGYMWGSASVIGLQLLPILGVPGDWDIAVAGATDLGIAFQLTNFIRDVGEDYRRGRIYLPLDGLAQHGVTPEMFGEPTTSAPLRSLVRAEVERARGFYRSADLGIAELSPESRDCVRTASTLYGEILDVIEHADYEVLAQRATVGQRRRIRVGVAGYARAVRARH